MENLGPAPAEVSLLFSFQNGTGAAQDKAGGHYNRPFVVLQEGEKGREAPSVVMEGMFNTFGNFQMPGVGIPGFMRRSIEMARAGVYNMRIHYEQVVLPLLKQWNIADLEDLTPQAAQYQEKLMALPEKIRAQAERFEARFGVRPAMWHSELTPARRRDTWRAVADGKVRVVVGARSALFLPFQSLGLIVVDEEHDGSFKQEEGVVYNARDMAVVRARMEDIPLVLVSATPSLETVTNVSRGRYKEVTLPDRHGGSDLAAVSMIDMRKDGTSRGRWLSPALEKALEETFQAKEQAMLFLNRRGYAPLTLCRTCGHRLQCPRCTAWLVEHRQYGRLQCHHCGFQTRPPEICPNCEDKDSMVSCGPGVERLAEEIQILFPEARTVIAASDMVQGPKQAAELVRQIEDKEVDLIIGTQIVAKGYHFPGLALVGVVDERRAVLPRLRVGRHAEAQRHHPQGLTLPTGEGIVLHRLA